jgi:RNA polymerase sigma-70 factor (ECF subfamily)
VKEQEFSNMTDEELLLQYRQTKDNNWLGLLLRRYTRLLLGVSMKYLKDEEEAKDNVQQVFIKVLEEMDRHQVTYFKSWLYMVVKNQCLMKLRAKKNKNGRTIDVDTVKKLSEEDSAPDDLLTDQNISLLQVAIGELKEDQRKCIQLFYLEKHSYQEICDSTGYSLLQVKSHIQNGKRNLKILLEKSIAEKG